MAPEIALRGAFRCDPTLLFLESEELRRKALPVGKDGREVLREVADLARQDLLALGIEHLGGRYPCRYKGSASLEQPCPQWIFDPTGA